MQQSFVGRQKEQAILLEVLTSNEAETQIDLLLDQVLQLDDLFID